MRKAQFFILGAIMIMGLFVGIMLLSTSNRAVAIELPKTLEGISSAHEEITSAFIANYHSQSEELQRQTVAEELALWTYALREAGMTLNGTIIRGWRNETSWTAILARFNSKARLEINWTGTRIFPIDLEPGQIKIIRGTTGRHPENLTIRFYRGGDANKSEIFLKNSFSYIHLKGQNERQSVVEDKLR